MITTHRYGQAMNRYGQAMKGLTEYATSVVRLFPDYAGSAIWFWEPVPYEVTGLSSDLVRDLQAWEESYYGGLDAYAWRSADLGDAFAAEGKRLAHRLASELGDEFAVEYDVLAEPGRRRVRGPGPPRNPAAAAAFRELAAEARAEHARITKIVDQARRDGDPLEWRAY